MTTITKSKRTKRTTPRLKYWAGRIQTGVEAQGMTIVRIGRDLFRVTREDGTIFCEGNAETVSAVTYDTPFMRARFETDLSN